MPRGRYSLHDPHDRAPLGEEHFRCAPGSSGWRYVSEVTDPSGRTVQTWDLAIDDLGRPLRLEARAGGWQVRGAAMDGVTWVRTDPAGEQAQPGNAAAHAFTGPSPAFLVATARLLALCREKPGARVRLVALTAPVLAPRTLDQAWTLLGTETHDTDSGPLHVDTYRVDDQETGERQTVHLAGDVVLAAPGIELEELESPPSVLRTAE
ncbi:hypothetical protein GCM10009716_49190 [Streptomyces sodiiphilus]|uniref:Uncharacterized protein n=1 Tax=Streptomyces sodiiphilus TaxID=226217 RepID=A0ABN2PX62_9ACTN